MLRPAVEVLERYVGIVATGVMKYCGNAAAQAAKKKPAGAQASVWIGPDRRAGAVAAAPVGVRVQSVTAPLLAVDASFENLASTPRV